MRHEFFPSGIVILENKTLAPFFNSSLHSNLGVIPKARFWAIWRNQSYYFIATPHFGSKTILPRVITLLIDKTWLPTALDLSKISTLHHRRHWKECATVSGTSFLQPAPEDVQNMTRLTPHIHKIWSQLPWVKMDMNDWEAISKKLLRTCMRTTENQREGEGKKNWCRNQKWKILK